MNVKKRILFLLLAVLVLGLFCACSTMCEHEWHVDCLSPATCALCGVTAGEAPGHDWVEGDCTRAKTCIRCGVTEGSPLEHSWTGGQCGVLKTSTICGKTDGIPAGHNWTDATCQTPQTCADCGLMVGDTEAHAYSDWIVAEGYDFLRTCTDCGTEERVLLKDIHSAVYNEDGTLYYDLETILVMQERCKQIIMEYLSGTWKSVFEIEETPVGKIIFPTENPATITFSSLGMDVQWAESDSGEEHRWEVGRQTYYMNMPNAYEEGLIKDVNLWENETLTGVNVPAGYFVYNTVSVYESDNKGYYVEWMTESGEWMYLYLHPDCPYGILKFSSWELDLWEIDLNDDEFPVANIFVKDIPDNPLEETLLEIYNKGVEAGG